MILTQDVYDTFASETRRLLNEHGVYLQTNLFCQPLPDRRGSYSQVSVRMPAILTEEVSSLILAALTAKFIDFQVEYVARPTSKTGRWQFQLSPKPAVVFYGEEVKVIPGLAEDKEAVDASEDPIVPDKGWYFQEKLGIGIYDHVPTKAKDEPSVSTSSENLAPVSELVEDSTPGLEDQLVEDTAPDSEDFTLVKVRFEGDPEEYEYKVFTEDYITDLDDMSVLRQLCTERGLKPGTSKATARQAILDWQKQVTTKPVTSTP